MKAVTSYSSNIQQTFIKDISKLIWQPGLIEVQEIPMIFKKLCLSRCLLLRTCIMYCIYQKHNICNYKYITFKSRSYFYANRRYQYYMMLSRFCFNYGRATRWQSKKKYEITEFSFLYQFLYIKDNIILVVRRMLIDSYHLIFLSLVYL